MKLQSGSLIGATQSGLAVFSLDEIANGEDAQLASDAILDKANYELISWNAHVYGYSRNNESLVEIGKSGAHEVDVTGRLLAVAATDGLIFFELTGEGQVYSGRKVLQERQFDDATVRDDVLYVLDRQGLQIYNAAQPDAPVKLSELPLSEITGYFAFLDSGYLLVAGTTAVCWWWMSVIRTGRHRLEGCLSRKILRMFRLPKYSGRWATRLCHATRQGCLRGRCEHSCAT